MIGSLSVIGAITRQKKVKMSDSGEVASGRCVIMSLVDGGTEKARATCRERERRVRAREDTTGRGDAVVCK